MTDLQSPLLDDADDQMVNETNAELNALTEQAKEVYDVNLRINAQLQKDQVKLDKAEVHVNTGAGNTAAGVDDIEETSTLACDARVKILVIVMVVIVILVVVGLIIAGVMGKL